MTYTFLHDRYLSNKDKASTKENITPHWLRLQPCAHAVLEGRCTNQTRLSLAPRLVTLLVERGRAPSLLVILRGTMSDKQVNSSVA